MVAEIIVSDNWAFKFKKNIFFNQQSTTMHICRIPNLNNVSVIQAAKFSAVLTFDGKLLIWGGKFRQTEPT